MQFTHVAIFGLAGISVTGPIAFAGEIWVQEPTGPTPTLTRFAQDSDRTRIDAEASGGGAETALVFEVRRPSFAAFSPDGAESLRTAWFAAGTQPLSFNSLQGLAGLVSPPKGGEGRDRGGDFGSGFRPPSGEGLNVGAGGQISPGSQVTPYVPLTPVIPLPSASLLSLAGVAVIAGRMRRRSL